MSSGGLVKAMPALTHKIWPFRPSPKQQQFLVAGDVPEILWGGSAGAGKSSALLMSASLHIDHPNWRALLIRRTYADLALPGALMDMATQWWANLPGVKHNRQSKSFVWPSGATITFGHLDSPGDDSAGIKAHPLRTSLTMRPASCARSR